MKMPTLVYLKVQKVSFIDLSCKVLDSFQIRNLSRPVPLSFRYPEDT